MLRIRLQRFGKKKAPVFRIVVIESSQKREGKPVEILGMYNPKTKMLSLNVERAQYWVSVGAKPSETVLALIKREPTHDLKEGPIKFVAKARKEKEEEKSTLKTRPSKQKREKEKAAVEKAKADAEKAKAEAEAAAEKAKAEAEKPAEELAAS